MKKIWAAVLVLSASMLVGNQVFSAALPTCAGTRIGGCSTNPQGAVIVTSTNCTNYFIGSRSAIQCKWNGSYCSDGGAYCSVPARCPRNLVTSCSEAPLHCRGSYISVNNGASFNQCSLINNTCSNLTSNNSPNICVVTV